jgi:hypothetical protein
LDVSSPDQVERAAALLNRLMQDADFRARFRSDPAAGCSAHGLPELAEELSTDAGMRTLDDRESRSSLAGVVMAAAFEAASIYELADNFGSITGDVGGAIDRALTLSHLESLKGALAGEPDAPAAAAQPVMAPPADDVPEGVAPGMAAPDLDVQGGGGAADAADDMGGGGPANVDELLHDRNLELDPEAAGDLKSGVVDPRLVSMLDRLTQDHEIGVSVIKTGHDQFVAGSTSVSNHFTGRAVDISTVDGAPVNSGNAAAREVAGMIAELPASIRPSEVGTPFSISAPGFFTDGAHQDHLHVGYDDPAPKGLKLPGADAGGGEGVDQAPAGGDHESVAVKVAEVEQRKGSVELPAVGDQDAQADIALSHGFDLQAAAADYPGDNAGQEEIAQWMARHTRAAGLPRELPVMAGLVESGLRNVDYGDADSLGFFQMRVSIWNKGEYAGYPNRPELQLKWFIDQAKAVAAQRDPASLRDPSSWGNWVADIERPAEQYRYKYALELGKARSLIR